MTTQKDGFYLAAIAEIGIIALALVYDAELTQTAVGLLAGLLGGYGVGKSKS